MTFKEQEQFTKKNSDDLLTELSNYHGENLISEIVRLGIQNLMELVTTNAAKIGAVIVMGISPGSCILVLGH